MRANVCHLDLTVTNVVLQDDRSNVWDVLRWIDFGFAQIFNKDKLLLPCVYCRASVYHVCPPLLAVAYTSPINVVVTQIRAEKARGYALHCPAAHQQVEMTPALLCQKLMLSAENLYIDVRTKDIKPAGATTPYAPPELL